MSFETKGLREERAKLVADWRTSLEVAEKENRSLTTEEKAASDKYEADISAATERIDRLERAEAATLAQVSTERPIETPEGAITDETRALGMQSWFMAQSGLEPTQRHLDAARRIGVNPGGREISIRLRNTREYRAGMSTTDNVGGYTIPEGFVNSFEMALLAYGGMRGAADVIRTATGNNLPWPTGNDTSNTGELLTEETTIGSTVNATVGVKTFYAYKMSSKLMQISPELLQDSAFDMASQIGTWLGERIGRIENTYYTTGTGSSQPTGILATSGGATVATLSSGNAYTASATAITTDELIDLIHSIDSSYRPGASFMMHDYVVRYLRKLKDGDGQYIWQPGITAGVGDRLFGYPVVINLDMASSITNSAKCVIFGQLPKFKIRDVAEVRLRRLVERYADTDQEGFVAFHRTDSGLLDAGTRPVKYLLQSA